MYIVYRFHCYTSTKAMQVRAKYFCCTKVHNINTETLLCKYYANNSYSQALYKNPCGIHVLPVLSFSLSRPTLFNGISLVNSFYCTLSFEPCCCYCNKFFQKFFEKYGYNPQDLYFGFPCKPELQKKRVISHFIFILLIRLFFSSLVCSAELPVPGLVHPVLGAPVHRDQAGGGLRGQVLLPGGEQDGQIANNHLVGGAYSESDCLTVSVGFQSLCKHYDW